MRRIQKMSKKKKDNFDIEILGHKFNVLLTSDKNLLLVNGRECLGVANPGEGYIRLSSEQTAFEQRQTLTHEILHCIDWIMHNGEFKYDEETIDTLARGLVTLRKDI